MQLSQDHPDFRYVLRAVRADAIVINERELNGSFILAPNVLVEDWRHATPLVAADLAPVLELDPEIVLLGTGETQRFPAADVMAACLTRGIGIEVMNNAAAARTFNVLATERRRVVAAFVLPGA